MSKETKKHAKQPDVVSLPIVNADAAGIDVSATMHMVAIPAQRDVETVRKFGAFTQDLHQLAQWLVKCRITTVAMESTGVYWKQLFTVLLEYGLEVALVNARHVKNVTGKKTDVADARWLQKLHSCGILNSCFLPDDDTEKLRNLVRHRKSLLQDGNRYILRMQKAMELMNLKIHSTISDIMGKTGRAIIEAIVVGERKAENFLMHIDPRIRADTDTLIKSLTGNWREDQLFLLKQNYELYKMIEKYIAACEAKIESFLKQQVQAEGAEIISSTSDQRNYVRKKKSKNEPHFDVRKYLMRVLQVDVTEIYGISSNTALEILSETGTQMSKWPTENHFVSWLNLCPNNKITGGKLISSMVMKKKAGNATQAFRAAANTVQRSDHWLGDYFRRMKSKGGNKYAIVATARKLAIIYYKMVRNKQPFMPMDKDIYREKYRLAKIGYLEKQLSKLKATG
jgi:transposase